jgi:hypothetical protein
VDDVHTGVGDCLGAACDVGVPAGGGGVGRGSDKHGVSGGNSSTPIYLRSRMDVVGAADARMLQSEAHAEKDSRSQDGIRWMKGRADAMMVPHRHN